MTHYPSGAPLPSSFRRTFHRGAMLARPLPKRFGLAAADQGPDPGAFLESPRFSLRLRRFLLVFGYGGLGVAVTLALLTGELRVGKGGPHRAPCSAGYVHNGTDCNDAPGSNSATHLRC